MMKLCHKHGVGICVGCKKDFSDVVCRDTAQAIIDALVFGDIVYYNPSNNKFYCKWIEQGDEFAVEDDDEAIQ